MGSRMIRDDMLDSERLQTLPIEARWLYVTILLTADDVGLFEVSPYGLGRRAGVDQQKVPVLIQLLADSDLIRVYESAGKRFAFIPRFRQRLRQTKTKHPAPPEVLMKDDEHASNQIKDLASKLRTSAADCGGLRPEEEVEVEEEKTTANAVVRPTPASNPTYRVPDCPYEGIRDAYHDVLPMLPRVVVFNDARKAPIRARWVEVCAAEKYGTAEGLQWFRDYFASVSRSAFLTGRSKSTFKADLEWLLAPKNFAKTVEGRYAEDRK